MSTTTWQRFRFFECVFVGLLPSGEKGTELSNQGSRKDGNLEQKGLCKRQMDALVLQRENQAAYQLNCQQARPISAQSFAASHYLTVQPGKSLRWSWATPFSATNWKCTELALIHQNNNSSIEKVLEWLKYNTYLFRLISKDKQKEGNNASIVLSYSPHILYDSESSWSRWAKVAKEQKKSR